MRLLRIAIVAAGMVCAAVSNATAQPPRLEVRPSSLDLGTTEVGGQITGQLQLHNVGGLPLTVQRVTVGSGPFAVSSQGPFTFPPGAFWAIVVSFSPTEPGTFSSGITIDSNDPVTPVVVVPVIGVARSPIVEPPVTPPLPQPPGKPLGALGADLLVTGATVTVPAAGSIVSQDARLKPEGYVFASGNGPVTGAWIVDGVTVERFTIDVWGGRPVRVSGLVDLPSMAARQHELVLEILEPRGVRSPPVKYMVVPGTSHQFRLLVDPGFRIYLRRGTRPVWLWTPKAGASRFDVALDGRLVDRVDDRAWALPDDLRAVLEAGGHEVEIRALTSPAGDGADAGTLEVVRSRFTLLDAPDTVDLSVTQDALAWANPADAGLFSIVMLDAAGLVVLRKITRNTTALVRELAGLAPDTRPLRIRVEALNDLGETVAVSAVHEIAK